MESSKGVVACLREQPSLLIDMPSLGKKGFQFSEPPCSALELALPCNQLSQSVRSHPLYEQGFLEPPK